MEGKLFDQKFKSEKRFALLLSKYSAYNKDEVRTEKLTKLAEENVTSAYRIVKLIEDSAIKKWRVFHLIENIVKNQKVGGVYGPLFTINIASLFSSVYRTADNSTRISLKIKRMSWLNLNVFPLGTLYALDVQVKDIDPKWPVMPPPPTIVSSLPSSSNARGKELKRKVRSEDDNDQQPEGKKSRTDPDGREMASNVRRLLPNDQNKHAVIQGAAKRKLDGDVEHQEVAQKRQKLELLEDEPQEEVVLVDEKRQKMREEAAKKRKADVTVFSATRDDNRIEDYHSAICPHPNESAGVAEDPSPDVLHFQYPFEQMGALPLAVRALFQPRKVSFAIPDLPSSRNHVTPAKVEVDIPYDPCVRKNTRPAKVSFLLCRRVNQHI